MTDRDRRTYLEERYRHWRRMGMSPVQSRRLVDQYAAREISGGAGIAFDAAGQQSANGVTSLTFAVTITTGDLIIVGGGASDGSVTVTGVTWNTVSNLTLLIELNNGVGAAYGSMWYLIAPATGTHNVVVTYSGNVNAAAGAIVLAGTHQTTPFSRVGVSAGSITTDVTVTAPSAVGEWVVDAMTQRGGDGGNTPGAGQTGRVNTSSFGDSMEMSTKDGAASVVMDWTLIGATSAVIVAGSVQPAAVAAEPLMGVVMMS